MDISGLYWVQLLMLYVSGLLVSTDLSAQTKRPNILFIYTDDQAYWTLGASGNTQASTPHLDRLASEGAFFENAFVTTPVCSPSRAALMSGQYASEYGILDFIPQPGHALYDSENPIGLNTSSLTFPEVLQHKGYRTGLVGKWHLGDWIEEGTDRRFHPTNHGFGYFMGLTGGGVSPLDPILEENGQVQQFQGLTDDILTDRALDFMEAQGEHPFLLSIHYRSPHSKWLPVAEEDWSPYENMDMQVPHPDYPDLDTARVKSRMKEYLASCSGVDRNVGKVLDKLQELGLKENTVVIFTSDHGYNMGHNGIEHKGNGYWITKKDHAATENIAKNSRPNLYDHSLRVPVLVRWPGVVLPGSRIEETVTNLDWYPTILEMVQSDVPPGKIIRGRSMVPLLAGEEVEDWDNDLYAEYSMVNYSTSLMRSYRTREWKLVKDLKDPGRDELYHLATDPEERTNLILNNSPEITRRILLLTEKIHFKMEEIGDPLLYAIKKP